jgi:hypothetical protein
MLHVYSNILYTLDENNKMHNNGQHCWVSCIYYILKELDMLKMFKSPLNCGAREINIKMFGGHGDRRYWRTS